ncbi:MAG: hypothetical protein GKC03_02475 [Methanomassiliicoccales archaeon]|jgi:hypothetical protein|nr:hypothetical protein [Methanomassiliicoccales archaeon]NYT14929.1 hypothetical protein [Methanomassiliicoccales archaeon]
MFLMVRFIEKDEGSPGVMEILERKTITCMVRLGMIEYDNQNEKEFFLDALKRGGASVMVLPR